MGLDIDIGVKNSRVRSGLAQIESEVNKFSGSLTGMFRGALGGFGAAFSVQGILALAEKMHNVRIEALRMGTSAENVQRIGKMAKTSGVDFEALAKTMNKVTLEAGKAANGDKASANLFKRLHMDGKAFASLSMDQKLVALSAAFERSRSSGDGTAAMLELIGERGTEIIPVLARGPKALADGMREAEVQSTRTVNAMDRLFIAAQRLKTLGAKAAAPLAGPAVQYLEAEGAAAKSSIEAAKVAWNKGNYASAAGNALSTVYSPIRAFFGYKKQGEIDQKQDAAENKDTKPAEDYTGAANATKVAELKKSIVEDEERNRVDALVGEARLNELMRARAELESQINDDTVEGLEAKKRGLAMEQEINQLQKSGELRYRAASQREAETLEKEYLEKATPKEKKAYLQNKQQNLFVEAKQLGDRGAFERPRAQADALDKAADDDEANRRRFTAQEKRDQSFTLRNQADDAEKVYDPIKAAEKRTEAEGLQGEIDGSKGGKGSRVALAVDSLQRAGGGGRAYGGIGTDPAQRSRDKQTRLLEQIRDALGKGDVTVGPPVKSPY